MSKQLDSTGVEKIASMSKNESKMMVNVTYTELRSMRSGNGLKPGRYYRITDYTTTSNFPDTSVGGHDFDVIVRADSENTLNENARAARRSGDTYFANSHLESWRLKYCLDNDESRFSWAKSTGRGVIYWMRDEFGNECPYDFKNIRFTTYSRPFDLPSGVALYTFSIYIKGIVTDASLNVNCRNNKIAYFFIDGLMNLNANVFIFRTNTYSCYNNTLGYNCRYNTFGNYCGYNTFGDNCYSNTFRDNCYSNTFRDNCNSNTFRNDCGYNTLGYNCNSNTFRNDCGYNTLGDNCDSNTFGNYCDNNTFGNNFYGNTLGDGCNNNTFGNYCDSNTFGSNSGYNTFRNDCDYNTLGNDCYNNTFGNNCYGNTLGTHCCNIMLGNDCGYNTLEDNCYGNTFGTHCSNNMLGNGCDSNTFGNGCDSNTFGSNIKTKDFHIGKIYIKKDNAFYPAVHPDLSTQPSILPQRYGNLPIYEMLVAPERWYEIPPEARIIEAFSHSKSGCMPAIARKLSEYVYDGTAFGSYSEFLSLTGGIDFSEMSEAPVNTILDSLLMIVEYEGVQKLLRYHAATDQMIDTDGRGYFQSGIIENNRLKPIPDSMEEGNMLLLKICFGYKIYHSGNFAPEFTLIRYVLGEYGYGCGGSM